MRPQLKAQERTAGTSGDLNTLRKNRQIPAIVYGHGKNSQMVAFDYKEFVSLFASAGTSSIVDLSVGNSSPIPVIISEIQRDPVNDRFLHVDLHAVRMDEKIKAELALNFVNESPAVKAFGANLIISKDTIMIECLPGDLISSFDVDISKLEQFNDTVRVSDLSIPQTITVLDDPSGSIVSALEPKEEKVEAVAPTAVLPEAEQGGEPNVESTEGDTGKKASEAKAS